ncbi:MAG: L,D-transpeptidase family protein [Pseudomonadota bacterium]
MRHLQGTYATIERPVTGIARLIGGASLSVLIGLMPTSTFAETITPSEASDTPHLAWVDQGLDLTPLMAPDNVDAVSAFAPPRNLVDDIALTQAIAARLATALEDESTLFASDRERKAVASFYQARDFAPIWVSQGRLTIAGNGAATRLELAADDGLDPADYDAPPANFGLTRALDAETLAHTELKLAASIIRYARDARGARINPDVLGEFVDIKRDLPNRRDVLQTVAAAGDTNAALQAYNPQHGGYQRLRERLIALRDTPVDTEQVVIEGGPLLKPGMRDERVPDLRIRFDLPVPQGDTDRVYDTTLVTAVKAFQADNDLTVDGIIGPQTLAVMNGDLAMTADDIIVNMERWRWLPSELGAHHVFVNVPQYHLDVVSDGETVFDTRVIVGTYKTQTPLFSDEIEHLVVNPSWNVPRSIAGRSIIPAVRRDPTYLVDRDFAVYMNVGGRFQPVDPASINWDAVRPEALRFRQRPGSSNALGDVKFMFPNKHAVYLHDTNGRGLFRSPARALSNGCVRVENPIAFSEALLTLETNLNGNSVERRIGGGEAYLNLDRHVPVHLAYFTAVVDEDGTARVFNDIYGHDRRMKQLLAAD